MRAGVAASRSSNAPREIAAVPQTPNSISHMSAIPSQARARTGAKQVYEALRAQILSLELTPGMVLERSQLAEQFGVSQTPVRDALLLLAREGLVESLPQFETRVSPIEPQRAQESYFMQKATEYEVLRALTVAPRPELGQRLAGLAARAEGALVRNDHDSFRSLNRDFHAALYAEAGMSGLWELFLKQAGDLERLLRQGLVAQQNGGLALQELKDIARIVGEGDRLAAQSRNCMNDPAVLPELLPFARPAPRS
jgi:GntR family transcriptional regulator, rspAB operon transcriptional repressor